MFHSRRWQRPPRTARKRSVIQKLPYREGVWLQMLPKKMPGEVNWNGEMEDQRGEEESPGLAIRKILRLSEGESFESCAIFVNRLSNATLSVVIAELPVDIIIDAIPDSLPVLYALYSRVFTVQLDISPARQLLPGRIIKRVIQWLVNTRRHIGHPGLTTWRSIPSLGGASSSYPDMSSISRSGSGRPSTMHSSSNNSWKDNPWEMLAETLHLVACVQPSLKQDLAAKCKSWNRCLVGLGGHGLVDTDEGKLMQLHDALRYELRHMVQRYKGRIQKLEELNLARNKTPVSSSLHKGPAPTSASHQRMMQVSLTDVQQRLIRNKTLLNVMEPATLNKYFLTLLKILESRVNADKEAMREMTQLQKDFETVGVEVSIVPILQRYLEAASLVTEMFSHRSLSRKQSLAGSFRFPTRRSVHTLALDTTTFASSSISLPLQFLVLKSDTGSSSGE